MNGGATIPPAEYDDICRVCGTYCPEGRGIHAVCDKALQEAYAEGRADQRADDAAQGLLAALQEAECALSLMHSYGHCRPRGGDVADVAQVRAGNALEQVTATIAKATGA